MNAAWPCFRRRRQEFWAKTVICMVKRALSVRTGGHPYRDANRAGFAVAPLGAPIFQVR